MKILAISGSTRKESFNTKLLHVTKGMLPEHDIEIVTINHIPMFNQDLEVNLPVEVAELKQKAFECDALIIATPEYNHMVPGALKNTIEWLTRDSGNVLDGKWLAIVGCSDGGFGTVRAQLQLMNLALVVNMQTMGRFRFPVSRAQDKFNEAGELTDTETKEKLKAFLDRYITFLKTELNV
jgi:chromate reductase